MMDAIRYMVVWNPLVFSILGFVLHFFGPHRVPGPPGGPPLAAVALANATSSPLALGSVGAGGAHLGTPALATARA